MARYVCPSCGASYNGRKCRRCYYAHFSEEIAHGSHTHRGEPLVIDAPVRRPIPRKDPFGCDRKQPRPGRRRKKHPLLGFLVILVMINSMLPMLMDWGLELEERERALAQPEPMAPQDLVVLHEEGPVKILAQPEQLTDFADSGLSIWVENAANYDVFVAPKYITVNGFVMDYASLYVEGSAGSTGKGTLYLDDQDLTWAGISQVQELSFVLEVTDEDYTHLFETEPITLSATGRPLEQQTDLGGEVLVEDKGHRLSFLGYEADWNSARFEDGVLKFYVENDTDAFLCLSSMEVLAGGQESDLYLWAEVPARSRAVVRMYLYDLEDLEWTTPSELGDLDMTVEFWDPADASASGAEYRFTVALTEGET